MNLLSAGPLYKSDAELRLPQSMFVFIQDFINFVAFIFGIKLETSFTEISFTNKNNDKSPEVYNAEGIKESFPSKRVSPLKKLRELLNNSYFPSFIDK